MDEFYHPYSCRVKAPIGQIGAFRFSSITPVGHSAPTVITMKIGSPRPEPQPGPLDSRFRGNDGAEAGRHFHPRMWPARAWVIIMKIDANRHSGAEPAPYPDTGPESRGGAVDSRFRGSDGWEAGRHFHPCMWPAMGMGNYHENRHPPAPSFPRKRESRVSRRRRPLRVTHPSPLDSGVGRNDELERLPSFSSSYVARKGMGNSGAGGNDGSTLSLKNLFSE